MKKPKILISLFRVPYPAVDGTRQKILNNVILGLARDFELEFFIVTTEKVTQDQIDYLENNFGKVHLFTCSKFRFLFNALIALGKDLPLQTRVFYTNSAQKWLNENTSHYDAYYIHEIRMTEYFVHYSELMKKKTLIDFNDAISLNYKEMIEKVNFLKKIFYGFEGNRVAHYEKNMLGVFHFFTAVSDRDRSVLVDKVSMNGRMFMSIPLGITTKNVQIPLDETKHIICFLGQLDYAPNKDALVYFIENILPKLREKIPDVLLKVIGRGNIIQVYHHLKNVEFTGFVPDLFEAMKQSSLLVAPIRFGAGMPSKIIETMSFGLPVITTPLGAAGIFGVKNNETIVIHPETDIDAWIASIEKIFNDQVLRKTLGENAKRFIEENYSSEKSQESFRKLFHEIIG